MTATADAALINHLLDAAGAASYLWDAWVPSAARRHLESDLEPLAAIRGEPASTLATAVTTLAAGLHDIGKGSPVFQSNSEVHYSQLDPRLRIPPSKMLPPRSDRDERRRVYGFTSHGVVGDAVIQRENGISTEARGPYGLRDPATNSVTEVVSAVTGGHHGYYSEPFGNFSSVKVYAEYARGGPHTCAGVSDENTCVRCWWDAVPVAHMSMVEDVVGYRLSEFSTVRLSPASRIILGAVVVLADWTASNTDLIPLTPLRQMRPMRMDAGIAAARALELPKPWHPTPCTSVDTLFRERFPSLPAPTPVQRAAVESARRLQENEGGLLFLEAPAGCGKTEAALAAAEIMASRNGMSGAAYLLPTRVTSNAMFRRVTPWVTRTMGGVPAVVTLSHAKAAQNPDAKAQYRPFGFKKYVCGDLGIDECCDADQSEVGTHSWLSGNGRKLLSPFVIGTVDSILEAVIIGKHINIRHLGLASKVVIVDEVHDSDPHMRELLCAFLEWASEYKIPVIVMTATASASLRNELHTAYSGVDEFSSESKFPCASTSSRGVIHPPKEIELGGTPLPGSGSVEFALRTDLDSVERIAAEAVHLAENGACVAVVCNTVRRAQQVMEEVAAVGSVVVSLRHSRFLSTDRHTQDRELLSALGKSVVTRKPQVVVATQVIEQSLDIDFDCMISDAAPMDILIQRAGRVHRHTRDERPKPCLVPKVHITGVKDLTECTFDRDIGAGYVYPSRRLMDTVLWLASSPNMVRNISLARDTPEIMRILDGTPIRRSSSYLATDKLCVPDFIPPSLRGRWQKEFSHELAKEDTVRKSARTDAAIDRPDEVRGAHMHMFPKSSPMRNREKASDLARRAETRGGAKSPEIVILVRGSDGGLYLPPHVIDREQGGIRVNYLSTSSFKAWGELSTCTLSVPPYGVTRWGALADNLSTVKMVFGNRAMLLSPRAFVLVMEDCGDGELEGQIGSATVRYTLDAGLTIEP